MAIAAGAILAAMVGACREPTQVTLDITYGGPCAELGGVGLIVATDPFVAESRIESNVFTASVDRESCSPGSPSRIGTLVVTPNDDTGRLSVVVIASFGKSLQRCKAEDGYFGCIVARRTLSFIDHTKLSLDIPLDPSCKNVPCDAVSTCRKGTCVESFVECDSSKCGTPGDPGDGGLVSVDAPTSSDAYVQRDAPADAPVTDAPLDAPVDAPADTDAGCSLARANIACRYDGQVPSTSCANPTDVCCWAPGGIAVIDFAGGARSLVPNPVPGGASYACRTTNECAVSAENPKLDCLGPRNCDGGKVCCKTPMGGSACQAACAVATDRVCLENCDCGTNGRCDAAPAVGTQPPQNIRYCAQ